VRPFSETILEVIVPWLELDWPLDWDRVFGMSGGPLVCEIGFGSGGFLLDLARRRPDVRHIGIEVSWGPMRALLRGIERSGVRNIRVVKGDAAAILAHTLPNHSLAEVHVNFPDPWYKKKHRRRRLLQPGFLRLLADRMVPGGRLAVATDHADLADWIAAVLEAHPDFESNHATQRQSHVPDRTPTKYEEKARALGTPIHYFDWRNVTRRAAPTVPRLEIAPMPNVILAGPSDVDAIMGAFRRHAEHVMNGGEEVVVSFVRAWRRTDEREWLVETHVHDGRLAQQVALVVAQREAERVTIRLAPLGSPRTTWGLKRAVWLLARAYRQSAPDLEVVRSTVGPLDGEH